MPATRDSLREGVLDRQTEERIPFDAVVRRDRSEDHLHEDQDRDDPDVLRRSTHRGRRLHPSERIGGRQYSWLVLLGLSIVVDQDPDAEEEHQYAEARPEVERSRSDIADRRVVRPIVRIAHIRPRAIRHTYPRSPGEEGAHLCHLVRVFQTLLSQSVG